jgi:hypothetical protein
MRLFGSGISVRERGSRQSRSGTTPVVTRRFEATMIQVSLTPRYESCQFVKCTFLWSGRAALWRAKVFLDCTFDDCDFGMPDNEFLAFAEGAVVNRSAKVKLTRQQALDEAVRRYRQRTALPTGPSLDSSSDVERQQLLGHIREEYRKIVEEGGR